MDKQRYNQEVILHLLRIGLGAEDFIPDVTDWDAVYDLAMQQCVLPFVFDGYIKKFDAGEDIPQMTAPMKKKWIGASYFVESGVAAQEKASTEMALLFADNHIRTYVLKGQIVAECYPIPQHRRSVDMDCFLVPADGRDFDAWERGNVLMEKRGVRVSRGFYKNSTLSLPGLTVENHIYLTPFRGNRRLKELEVLLQTLIRSDTGKDKMEGSELYRPPVMASALFLVEHAFSHFLHEGLNLRHITDWMMFSRYHHDDIDWTRFSGYIDEFGFRRFFDAYVHVGEYILGERTYSALCPEEQRMMDSVWAGLDLHDTVKGFRGKLNLVGNTLRASWKYHYFAPISMFHALWIQVKGFLFIRHPKL